MSEAKVQLRIVNTGEDPREVYFSEADKFLLTAKGSVVENYNRYHNIAITPPISLEQVVIVWFAKVLDNWKAIVAVPVVRGMLYEVTFDGVKQCIYIDVYKKIKNVKIPHKETKK